jgi:endo-1,4-beta-xylanase
MEKKKIVAGALSMLLLGTSVSLSSFSAQAETAASAVYETGFEDNVVDFTGRGGVETLSVTTAQAHTGSYSLCVSGRTQSWNGPQLSLDDRCQAGVEYTVSAWVRAAWYDTINLSMEYTDSDGVRHYNVLKSVSGSDWMEFSDVKLSFSSDVTNVYVYFESSDKPDLYIDDFSLKSATVYDIQEDIASLQDVYADYFKVGTAVTTSELAPSTAKDLILKHFNSITPGNELKPDSLLDYNATIATGSNVDPQVSLANARSILNFCRDNNISVRGHVLVWHQQTPDWFFRENYEANGEWASKEVMQQRLENYIKNVFAALAEEYPTVDFYAYDVVNECYLDDGSARPGGTQADDSKNSPWVQIYGDNSFIEEAFTYARKYAPDGCKLYYNDYNEYQEPKTEAIYNMAMDLKEKGLIDGIGMQSHLALTFPSVAAYKTALEKFISTGLDVQITELDITVSDASETSLEEQAQMYSDILDLCVANADSISAVVFWGTTDDKSWRASGFPLLFNSDFSAKPAYYAIVDGFDDVENPTEEYVAGDVTGDGTRNIFDLVAMKAKLHAYEATADETYVGPEDYNQDGLFDMRDVVALAKYLVNQT